MQMYPRHMHPLVREMLAEFRVVYLTGPRQSGKTTLARGVASELGMRYVTLDDPAVRAAVALDPHGYIRSLAGRPVVLDEFQRVPELVPAIKEASDLLASEPGRRRTGRFLLTGSADIFRSARVQEALPGHMARLELLPLSLGELGGLRFNLIDALVQGGVEPASPGALPAAPTRDQIARLILAGGYPEVQRMSARAGNVWFRSYTEGRFMKDFENLYAARGDYRSRLRALVPYLAGLSGGLLRYAGVGNALQLNDKVVRSYIEVLEQLFLLRRLPAYRRNVFKREAVRMPKLHFVDTGLAAHLLSLRTEDRLLTSSHYGPLLETLIYTECAKHAQWADEDVGLHHFRDKRGREVDIVLERADGGIVGIEVKASATFGGKDLDGLATLAQLAGNRFLRGVLVYTGQHVLPVSRRG